MCLSTVYIQVKGQRQKVMQDVAKMEYSNKGYLLTGLLGDQKKVKGRIMKIDFVDERSVILKTEDY
jgi:predicted RNA-binding protein